MADCDLRELAAPYALGALDEDERERYESHAAGCATCAREIDALRDSLLVLAHTSGQETPPPELRTRILAAVERTPQAPEPRPAPARVPFWRRRPALTLVPAAALVAAAVVAVVLLTGGSSTPGPVRALGAHYSTVPLRGPGGSRTGSVYVNLAGRAVALVSMPPAPAGKAYQAWVMVGGRAADAKPAGLFAGGSKQYVILAARAHPGDVVGFTLEPASGSPRPTTQPLATAKI